MYNVFYNKNPSPKNPRNIWRNIFCKKENAQMVFKAAQHRAQHGATRRATHCSKFACQSSVAMYQSMAGPRFWRIVTIDARHNHQNQGLVIIDALHSSILQHSKFHVTCDNASNLTSAGSSFSPCPSGERENEERQRE